MNQIFAKSKKPRLAGVLLLSGAVMLVIGCARVNRTSFADLWPIEGNPVKKAAGKVASLVRPKAKDAAESDAGNEEGKVQVADARDAEKSKSEKQDAGDGKKKKGRRIVSLIGGERERADDAHDSGKSELARDPFLTPEERVVSHEQADVEDGGASGHQASDKETSPFHRLSQTHLTETESKPASTAPAPDAEEEDDKAVVSNASLNEDDSSWADDAKVPEAKTQDTPGQGGNDSAPAFADTFNSQMDRLRDEMNESNRRRVASTAPEPDFDAILANTTTEKSPAQNQSADNPAVENQASHDATPETRPQMSQQELPEFTRFANSTREPKPVEELPPPAKETEPAGFAKAVESPALNAPGPVMEVGKTATSDVPMPYIAPRRPVRRSVYPSVGIANLNSAPSMETAVAANVPTQSNATERTLEFRRAESSRVEQQESKAELVAKSEFTTSSKVSTPPAGAEKLPAPTAVEARTEAGAASPRENSTTASVASVQPATGPAFVDSATVAKTTNVIAEEMIVSNSQLRQRAGTRRSRSAAAARAESFTEPSQAATPGQSASASQQSTSAEVVASSQSNSVASPNRGLVISADGVVKAPDVTSSLPATDSKSSTSAEGDASQSGVNTTSFSDGSGPVVLANAADAVPIATTPGSVDMSGESGAASGPAKRSSNKWPPIVLGIAVAGMLVLFASRRLRLGM